ncbi:MAG: hypothetical protein ABIP88_11705 [Candidatus Binatia bacterium]
MPQPLGDHVFTAGVVEHRPAPPAFGASRRSLGLWFHADRWIYGLNRESLYKALSKGRNPRLATIMNFFSAMGCSIRLALIK